MQDCRGCELQRDLDELRKENERLRRKVDRLRRTVREVKAYALAVYGQAARVMNHHQPRGTWSLWRGRGETAREVYNKLEE